MKNYSPENRRAEAIQELVGEPCTYDVRGDEIIKWRSPEGRQPSEADIETKVAQFKAEYDALAWKRSRQGQEGYPSVGDQLDMLMKDMRDNTTTHQESCEAVKAKYPKPS